MSVMDDLVECVGCGNMHQYDEVYETRDGAVFCVHCMNEELDFVGGEEC